MQNSGADFEAHQEGSADAESHSQAQLNESVAASGAMVRTSSSGSNSTANNDDDDDNNRHNNISNNSNRNNGEHVGNNNINDNEDAIENENENENDHHRVDHNVVETNDDDDDNNSSTNDNNNNNNEGNENGSGDEGGNRGGLDEDHGGHKDGGRDEDDGDQDAHMHEPDESRDQAGPTRLARGGVDMTQAHSPQGMRHVRPPTVEQAQHVQATAQHTNMVLASQQRDHTSDHQQHHQMHHHIHEDVAAIKSVTPQKTRAAESRGASAVSDSRPSKLVQGQNKLKLSAKNRTILKSATFRETMHVDSFETEARFLNMVLSYAFERFKTIEGRVTFLEYTKSVENEEQELKTIMREKWKRQYAYKARKRQSTSSVHDGSGTVASALDGARTGSSNQGSFGSSQAQGLHSLQGAISDWNSHVVGASAHGLTDGRSGMSSAGYVGSADDDTHQHMQDAIDDEDIRQRVDAANKFTHRQPQSPEQQHEHSSGASARNEMNGHSDTMDTGNGEHEISQSIRTSRQRGNSGRGAASELGGNPAESLMVVTGTDEEEEHKTHHLGSARRRKRPPSLPTEDLEEEISS